MSLQNDLLIRAAKGLPVERIPVWLMRQAGRILPEYRAVRAKAKDFVEFVENPEMAAEVTLQPVDLLGVDAAIVFSDILVIPKAMGLPYQMLESKGPWFEQTIQTNEDLNRLHLANPEEDLDYVLKTIDIVKRDLNGRVPLIGFAGAPWTIFAYMTEGSGSKTFSKAKKMLYTQPELSHRLLDLITQSTIDYLKAQIEHGVDLVQVFDSWAGILSPAQYEAFALPYIQKICNAINGTPVTVFAKGAYFALESFSGLNCEVIGLDWNMPIASSRKAVGDSKTLQGNLDPCVLYADKQTIKRETEQMLNEFGPTRHIANLGHGVYPDVEADKVKYFIEVIKNHTYSF